MFGFYLEGLVGNLFPWSKPGSQTGCLGTWTACTQCSGCGYVMKRPQVWSACPECYMGRRLLAPSPTERTDSTPPLSLRNEANGWQRPSSDMAQGESTANALR